MELILYWNWYIFAGICKLVEYIVAETRPHNFYFRKHSVSVYIWAASWQIQQNDMCVQRRLGSAWASAQFDQSSLCAQWVAKDPSFLHADSEDSDQTGRMPRLIWVSLGAHVSLLVLSCGGSFQYDYSGFFKQCSLLRSCTSWFGFVNIISKKSVN